jgi:hypothetical protein
VQCSAPCVHHSLIPHKPTAQILRKIAAGEEESLGDVSTLADPSVVDFLIAAVGLKLKKA